MDFYAVLDQAVDLLRQRGRVTYRALKLQFQLDEKILTSRAALEGERKQVTVLFADLKGSMELLAERDPEEARHLLDPVLDRMSAASARSTGSSASSCAKARCSRCC